jgi:hypothetical protein
MALLMADRIDHPSRSLFGDAVGDEDGGMGGGPTLDDAIVGAWEGLAAHVAVACPLCEDGTLRPGARSIGSTSGGACDRCGATLA